VIFWKEWRRLRGRFFSLAGFYLITAAVADLDIFGESFDISALQLWVIGWGVAMLLIPAILGMDAWVGERDEETEDFLFSKPLTRTRLLLAKVGLRFLLTLILTSTVMVVLVIRAGSEVDSLYWWVRPYVTWYLVLSVLTAQLVLLMVTMAVSVRAPYQSTALILGGALGSVVVALPVIDRIELTGALQAPWGNYRLLLLFLVLTTVLTCYGMVHHEHGRSRP
jgi:ABC-type transport system involved in multi-copper enzyme maturation permease subunit